LGENTAKKNKAAPQPKKLTNTGGFGMLLDGDGLKLFVDREETTLHDKPVDWADGQRTWGWKEYHLERPARG